MRIYTNLDSLQLKHPTACGLGNFDGIHLGHQALISKLLDIAYKESLEPTIITFDPHPSEILTPDRPTPLLIPLEQKKKILEKLGIKNLVLVPFSREFSKITYQDFVKNILIAKCRPKINVVGFDYTFGYKGRGNAKLLKQICAKKKIRTYIMPPITHNNMPISSSLIRSLVKSGNMSKIPEFLGRPYSISGVVVGGNRIGKKLGFPTANINLPQNVILPPKGVYASVINVEGNTYKGAANLGLKPTFDGKTTNLEVHLFDFNQNIYGKNIEVFFIDMLRKEKRFKSAIDLQKQIKKDFVEVLKILSDIKL